MTAPFDRIIVLDIESAWASKLGFTLSKMTNEQYVRDPRFKVWGLCHKVVGDDTCGPIWVRRNALQAWVDSIDWSRTAVVAHNAQFDVSAMAWHYGMKPAFIFDTLSMARALRGVEVGNSLAKLAQAFDLPPKGNAVHTTDGILDELPFLVEQELAEYCKHDTFLCEEILKRFLPGYPVKELRLIDMTLRMYTQPVLELDDEMLTKALIEEKEKREGLLSRLGVDEKLLASNDELAKLLRAFGVEPPMKKKKATVKTPHPKGLTYAFAKNDAMFQALLNGDNEDVALLLETRLKVKSTTERTRAQRFLEISQRGALPVPLSYYGALSGRWTAAKGSACNVQNLKRGSFLRKAIMAPKGYQLVVGDLSQIEPRVLAWLTDYEELLDIFRAGGDPYATFGAQMFNIPGLTKEQFPLLRQSAKSALLGAQYGLSGLGFAAQLLVGFLGAPPVRYTKENAKQLGVTLPYIERFLSWAPNLERMAEIAHTCTDSELLVHCVAAKMIIDKYRATAYPVVEFWKMCDNLIARSLADGEEVTYKCLTFRKEQIILPNGMSIQYPNLRQQRNEERKAMEWVYGPDATSIFGPKAVNNLNQATARIVMTDGMLRVDKRYRCVLTVHDELVCLVPDEEVEEAKPWVLAQMVKEPKYLPGIPLAADGGAHRRYGLAKN